jgi:hypothetical protein
MARVIGYVKSFEHGTFFVKDAKGHTHQLKAGEAIHEGELVYGAKSNPNNAQIVIDVTLQGAGDLVIAGNGALNFDASLLKGIFVHDDAVVYVNSVKDALALNGHTAQHGETDNNNTDVTHGGEEGKEGETAAGNAVTDTEHTGDTFDLRDGLTQDVSTTVSGTGTSTASSTAIETTVVNFVPPTITVFVPSNTSDTTPTIIGASNQVGGTVTLTITDSEGVVQVITTVVKANGTYSAEVPNELGEGTFTVDAKVSDAVGNIATATDSGNIDSSAPVITVDAPENINDNTPTIIGTSDEIGATVTLKVTDSEGNVQTLQATVQEDGTYSADVLQELSEGTYLVEAFVSDALGNTANANDNGDIDTIAPILTVEAPDNTNDSTPTIIGWSDELGGTVTLKITDSEGNVQTVQTTVGHDGSYSVDVLSPLADGSYTVDASVSDLAGNSTNANDNGSVDTVPPSLTVTAADNTIDNTPTISGTSDEIGAKVTLAVTDAEGNVQILETIVQSDGTFSVDIPDGSPLVQGSYSVDATISDSANNMSSVSTPIVIITEDINNDGILTNDEINGTVGVTVMLPSGAVEGDILNVTGQTPITLTADQITAGSLTFEYDALADGASLSISATITNAAGNVSGTGSDSATDDLNDAPTVVVTVTATPVENSAAAGDPIATSAGHDEDGDTLVYSLTTNPGSVYAIDPATGDVTLTQAGADLVNGGGDLPKVEVTVTDPSNATGTDSETVAATIAVADIPNLSPIHDINVLNEGATIISTGDKDVVVTKYDMGAGVSQANLEAELGLPAGSLDNRFDPTGTNVNDPGFVDIIDGKTTEANYDMTSGMTVTWDYTFKNGEDLQSEVAKGFNDQVILVVTDPNGVKSYIMVDSSESKFPNQINNASYSYTATMDGKYTFDWLVLNAGDTWKDSSLALSNANFVVDGVAYSAPIALTALASAASLNDTDGSETLTVTISGLPSGAILTNGTDNHDGSWTLTSDQLANLYILPPDNYTGTLDLTVTATATESSNGDTASVSENFSITVSETSSTVTTGTEAADTLHGTGQNDLIRGYAGDDTITGGNGNDMIFGGAGNDTLDGEKGSDALYGGVGNDTLVFDAKDSVIDGGTGTDKLILLSGTSIDFSALDSSKISNIETIDLSQNGDHTLTNLSYADVINMTDSNHTLTILGDSANDKVQLTQTDSWSHSGTVTESGHTFDVYTSTGASATDPTVTVKVETVITDTVI